MEENKEYSALTSFVSSLEEQMTEIVKLQQQQDFNVVKRGIEEHFERCIHAVEARRHTLLSELEQIVQQQEERVEVIKQHITEMIQSCYEVMKAGSRFYKQNNINAAERIWQASLQEFENVEVTANDMQKVPVKVAFNFPSEFLNTIEAYGTVSHKSVALTSSFHLISSATPRALRSSPVVSEPLSLVPPLTPVSAEPLSVDPPVTPTPSSGNFSGLRSRSATGPGESALPGTPTPVVRPSVPLFPESSASPRATVSEPLPIAPVTPTSSGNFSGLRSRSAVVPGESALPGTPTSVVRPSAPVFPESSSPRTPVSPESLTIAPSVTPIPSSSGLRSRSAIPPLPSWTPAHKPAASDVSPTPPSPGPASPSGNWFNSPLKTIRNTENMNPSDGFTSGLAIAPLPLSTTTLSSSPNLSLSPTRRLLPYVKPANDSMPFSTSNPLSPSLPSTTSSLPTPTSRTQTPVHPFVTHASSPLFSSTYNPRTVRNAFNAMDANEDGVLDRQELRNHFKLDAVVDGIINRLDKNKDGVISYSEFYSEVSKIKDGEATLQSYLERYPVVGPIESPILSTQMGDRLVKQLALQGHYVPMTWTPGIEEDILDQIQKFRPFREWTSAISRIHNRNPTKPELIVDSIHIQHVDVVAGKVESLKYEVATREWEEKFQKITTFSGVVFMRGETVGILCILIDVETSKEFCFMFLQPRIAVGDMDFPEIPAGMARDSIGKLVRELSDTIMFDIKEPQLLDLTHFAYRGRFAGVYQNASACDEFFKLYLYRRYMSHDLIQLLLATHTGEANFDTTKVKLVPLEDMWQETPDAKSLVALLLYEKYKQLKSNVPPSALHILHEEHLKRNLRAKKINPRHSSF